MQTALLKWCKKYGFNSLTLAMGDLFPCKLFSGGVAAFGSSYYIRTELEAFITNARKYGITNIVAMSSNEEFFISDYPDIYFTVTKPTPSYPSFASNPANPDTFGDHGPISVYNAYRTSKAARFDGICLELDWWRYPTTDVGFSNSAASKVHTPNTYAQQILDMRTYIDKTVNYSFTDTSTGKTYKATKPSKDMLIDAYFAHDDVPNSAGGPATATGQSEVQWVVLNSDRIMLADDSDTSTPDFTEIIDWNQLEYIAKAAQYKNKGPAQVAIIFYSNTNNLFDYFDHTNPKTNHPFDDAYNEVMKQYVFHYGALGPLSTIGVPVTFGKSLGIGSLAKNFNNIVPFWIQFIGYQIYEYNDASKARPY